MRHTITIPEFCRLTGITRQTGYSAARRDELPVPVIRIGKRMVIPARAVADLLGEDPMTLLDPAVVGAVPAA
jgi:hypothetical protein